MTTFNSIGLGRTIGAGVNLLQTSDFQLSVVTSGGGVTIILPSISAILQARSGSGNLSLIQFIISDISGLAGINNITLIAASGETINGVASIALNINNISAILTPTSNNSWASLASIGTGGGSTGATGATGSTGATGASAFNSPYDFYLDAAAPSGGDGSAEKPFTTITELNNAVIALADPTQAYVANVAPTNTGYGGEVVGDLNIAENLSLVGITPQNTGISCNIKLTSTVNGIVNQYKNVAFNGLFTLDLALATFASVVFLNGQVSINRIDSNPSCFVILQGGIGTSSISGTVQINGGILFGDITLNDGAYVYCTNLFIINGKFLLNGNSTLKTLSTFNPTAGYVDGTVDISGTPTWYTDESSNATYTGTVNKVIFTGWGMAGLAVLDAAGQIVVANANVKANTRFLITVQDGGTAPTGNVFQSARTVNTDFTIKSNAGAVDAGVQVYYQLYEPLT